MIKFEVDIIKNGVSVSSEEFADTLVSEIKFLFGLDEKHLKEITELVTDWIYENIHSGIDIFGNKVARKKRPSKIGGYTPFLGNEGLLYQGVLNKKISEQEYEVYIRPDRQEVASYLIKGTKYMPSRMFFGVSDVLINKINEYISKLNKY